MTSHRTLLGDLWPSDTELSQALRAQGVEVGVSTVGMWRTRDEIPSRYWGALVALAATEGKVLTLEKLERSQRRRVSGLRDAIA